MAQFKNSTLTYAGIAMITQSHALGDCLRFTKLLIGDGLRTVDADAPSKDKERVSLIHQRLAVEVADVVVDTGKRTATVVGHVDNSTIAEGEDFQVTEIGACARNAGGVERLYSYAYTDDAGKATWIYDKTVQIDGTDIDVVVAVSDASEISADISLRYLMSDPQLAALRRELERQMASQIDDKVKASLAAHMADCLWEVDGNGHVVLRELKAIAKVPSVRGSLTCNGAAQSPTWVDYDAVKMTIGGDTSATNAGTYTATFTPKIGWVWADGSSGPKSVQWTIAPQASGALGTIAKVPSVRGSLTYNGAAQSPTWADYDAAKLAIGGDTSATSVGTYTATFTPKPGWLWAGGSSAPKSVSWTIAPKSAVRLSVSTTRTTTANHGKINNGPYCQNADGETATIDTGVGMALVNITVDAVETLTLGGL